MTSPLKGLTDSQQAYLMFATFLIPPLITWSALGFLLDKVALGFLVSSLLSGALAFIKEKLGSKPTK